MAAFYSQSPKRKTNLKKFCEANEFRQFWPKKTFPVRWVQSHFDSNEVIFLHFKPLVLHLRKMLTDPEFEDDATTLERGGELITYLTHKNVILTLVIMLDIQDSFKGLSKEFQIRASSIIGQALQKKKLGGFWKSLAMQGGLAGLPIPCSGR